MTRSASRQTKGSAGSQGRRQPTRGLTTGPQVRFDLGPHVLEVGRQRELLPQVLERLVDGESRAQRRDLEEHAAGLAEVDRFEVEAVDHRGRLGAAGDRPFAPLARARRWSRPRRCGGRCRRPGSSARRAARHRGSGRRRASPRASQAPSTGCELERLEQAGARLRGRRCRRGRRGIPAAPARPAPRGGRRSAARRRPRPRAARARAPRGRRRSGPRPRARDSIPLAASRFSQKSSDSAEPTRQTIRWTSPAPARPAGTPGNSKKVRSEPALPFSSAKKRW